MTSKKKRPIGPLPESVDPEKTRVNTEQGLSDTDQALSRADQNLSDTDQALSNTDQAGDDAAQIASDRDQAAADRDHATHSRETASDEAAYQQSRGDRAATSLQRYATGRHRSESSDQRDSVAQQRDKTADQRDATSRSRLPPAGAPEVPPPTELEMSLRAQLEEARASAAEQRARAAADRLQESKERAKAARERARLEAELRSAHLDALTGAFRREMGPTAIASELERMQRTGGSMVVAFVDVDGLKPINDSHGHAAGDKVLQTVVLAMQAHLRPYDSIIRYGGDEFVCVLGDVDIAHAQERFAEIAAAIESEAQVTVSVGFATQRKGDTPERLVHRADAAMLEVKRSRHSG